MAKSTNLYALFETDPRQETGGIGLRFGTAVFYGRRAGGANSAFDKYMEEKTRNLANRAQLAAMTEEQSSAMLREAYAETVMTGWEGVTDREGNELSFSKANFVQLMTDLPVLWAAVRQGFANHENFLKQQAKQEGEAVGN